MNLGRAEAALLQALVELAHRGLAVAEDDRGVDVFAAEQVAQLSRLSDADRDHPLLDVDVGGRGTRDFDRLGSVRNLSASFLITGGIVAEKSSVWRCLGSLVQISSISGMNPMSSIRSASSITSRLQPVSRILPRP
jgi:hypothetical protein